MSRALAFRASANAYLGSVNPLSWVQVPLTITSAEQTLIAGITGTTRQLSLAKRDIASCDRRTTASSNIPFPAPSPPAPHTFSPTSQPRHPTTAFIPITVTAHTTHTLAAQPPSSPPSLRTNTPASASPPYPAPQPPLPLSSPSHYAPSSRGLWLCAAPQRHPATALLPGPYGAHPQAFQPTQQPPAVLQWVRFMTREQRHSEPSGGPSPRSTSAAATNAGKAGSAAAKGSQRPGAQASRGAAAADAGGTGVGPATGAAAEAARKGPAAAMAAVGRGEAAAVPSATKAKKAASDASRGASAATKEVRMTCRIAAHDLGIKIRKAESWLDDGTRAQVVVEFRGEEQSAAASALLDSVVSSLAHKASAASTKQQLRSTWTVTLRPLSAAKRKAAQQTDEGQAQGEGEGQQQQQQQLSKKQRRAEGRGRDEGGADAPLAA